MVGRGGRLIAFRVFWDGEPHEFDLVEGEHTVGRGECDLQIPKPMVGWHHAVLRVSGQNLFVRHVGHASGTDLDGVAVRSEELEVGLESIVRFAGVPAWRGDGMADRTLASLRADEILVDSQLSIRLPTDFAEASHTKWAEALSTLFAILGTEQDPDVLQYMACEFISRWLGAERVVLLEDRGAGSPLVPRAWSTRGQPQLDRLRLSSQVLDLVLNERRSILIEDAATDPRTLACQGVTGLCLRSAMAAPLLDNQRVRGILYVDSRAPTTRFGTDDLLVLTVTANAVAMKLSHHTMRQELAIAAEIQRTMLPPEVRIRHDDYEMAAHQEMCLEVGGDLYHCVPRPDGKHLVALGDVAGKGVSAALAMSSSMSLIRLLADIGGALPDVIAQLNRQLNQSMPTNQFLTLFLGELDPATGHLLHVNHGQQPPILVRTDGTIEKLASTGLPVGLFEECAVGLAEIQLNPGDLLAMYSDGILDATSDGTDFFGEELLERILQECREQPLSSICMRVRDEVNAFLGSGALPDDMTLVLLRRKGSA